MATFRGLTLADSKLDISEWP